MHNLGLKLENAGDCLLAMLNKNSGHILENKLWDEIARARAYNRWFTPENVCLRLNMVAEILQHNTPHYKEADTNSQIIGIFSDNSIPLEEFVNILAIVQCGHHCLYKNSGQPDKVLECVWEIIETYVAKWKGRVKFAESNLKEANKLFIRSNNPAMFEMCKKHSHANFVKQEHSAALLSGYETAKDLKRLANDVFLYFGQGCGNVRKLYVPEGYDFNELFEAFEDHNFVLNHSPWANNYQYHQSVFLMNRIAHLDNGFLLLREEVGPKSPTGVLYYEYYNDFKNICQYLTTSDYTWVYTLEPKTNNQSSFGNSKNQSMVPSKKLMELL